MTNQAVGDDLDRPQIVSSTRLAWRIVRQEPVAYAIALVGWITFHSLPVLAGVLLKALLDDVEALYNGTSGSRIVWGVLAAYGGVTIYRWIQLWFSAAQWHGVWVFWHTVPRLHMLASLLRTPGPMAGRLPGSSGEAVSRFRDDAKDVALVADVWLDIAGVGVGTLSALGIMAAVDRRIAAAVAVPVVLAVVATRLASNRLRALRLAERTATAALTGFIGDTFGAITTVKGAGAEAAVARRFDTLGSTRAKAALRDQVLTQSIDAISGVSANLAMGVALLLLAPSLAAGEATIGDVGLFTTAALVAGGLPRWIARLGAYTRQADVSAARMARLLPATDEPLDVGAPAQTWLRHGPPDEAGYALLPEGRRHPAATLPALSTLHIRGLSVDHGDGVRLAPVDLDLAAGTTTVVTGPVGAGKTTLLRAVLGMVHASGEVRWNGELLTSPSLQLVPPRVSYVPQVPRLFSESMTESILLGQQADALEWALAVACLTEDVQALPKGLDTEVGPRGIRLSGGQVQRVAAARAFVRRPDLLVVDDLSSALDVDTETRVWDALLEGDERPTMLIVSHRTRVLEAADQVIRLSPA